VILESGKNESMPREAHIPDVPLNGPVLIEANAGTGKTYALVHLYLRVLLEKSLLPSQVLLLTFTNAATDELKVRLRNLLRKAHDALQARLRPSSGDFSKKNGRIDETLDGLLTRFASEKHLDWLKWCLVSFDQAAIFTLNGFCQRVLQDFNHLCGSPVLEELEADSGQRLHEFLADYWRQQERRLDEKLLRFVRGAGIRLTRSGPSPSDKALQDLVGHKLNKSGFVDINQPEWPDTRALTQRLQQLEAHWMENRDQLVDKITAAGISRVTANPKTTTSLKAAVDDFFDQGLVDKKLLHFSASAPHKMNKGHEGNYPDDPFFVQFGQLLVDIQQLTQAYRYAAYPFVQEQFEQWRQSRGRYRYSDQIDLVHAAVTAGANNDSASASELRRKIQSQWPVALLDEFQDTDQRQFEIFESCYVRMPASDKPSALIMVGDPKQAIYGFRGADVFVYQEARNRVRQWQQSELSGEPENPAEPKPPAARLLSLATNWRSSEPLIAFVNRCFSSPLPLDDKNPELKPPFVLPHISYHDSQPPQNGQAPGPLNDPLVEAPVVLLSADQSSASKPATKENDPAGAENGQNPISQEALDDFVVAEIRRLLDEVRVPTAESDKAAEKAQADSTSAGQIDRPLAPKDVAILVANNRLCLQWYERLLKEGIPATLWSEQRVFDTAVALEVHDAVRAILRPTAENVRAVLLSSLCDFSLDEIAAESEPVRQWHTRLVQLNGQWKSKGLASLVDGLREDASLPRGAAFVPWLLRTDGERRVTDFNHLIELLAEQEAEGRCGEKLAQWLAENIQNTTTGNSEAAKRRLESDEQGVSIITLHKAKGLQFPVVFMPNLEKLNLEKSKPLYTAAPSAVCHYHRPLRDEKGASWQAVTDWQGDDRAIQSAFQEDLSEKRRLLYVGMTRAEQRLYLSCVPPGKPGKKTVVFTPYLPLLKSQEFAPWVSSDTALVEKVIGRTPRQLPAGLLPNDSTSSDSMPLPHLASRSFNALDKIQRVIQVSSFSGLVAGLGHGETGFSSEPLFENSLDEVEPASQASEAVASAHRKFLYFPKGPVAGNCFHEVMENCPLNSPDELAEARVASVLEKYGFAAEGALVPGNRPVNWAQCLREQAITVCNTPLNAAGLRLCDSQAHQPEMEFLLPAGQLRANLANRWLTAHRGQDVNAIRHQAIQGFLGGFIDLVFCHEGQYFVVDYKTNHLGFATENYLPAALQQAIEQHHYDLQYMLYSAVLLRLLRQRIGGFDYRQHFGGVYYLFVRGMGLDPDHPQAGVYFNRPDEALLDQILEALT